jgi:hypothetical protein
MAAIATLNPLDFLAYDDQITLHTLFDNPTRVKEPDTETEKNGWFIRHFPISLVDPFKALPTLATGLVTLSKSCYSRVAIKRVNTGGNFCGHDPVNPYFVMRNHPYFVPQSIDDLGNKRRSQILYDIVERVKAYYHDPDTLPSLQQANHEKRTSDRQRNSSRREALVNLLMVMVMNMDLPSFRVGQPRKNGGFFNYSLKWLAKKAELSFSRAKRAMSDLNHSMLISSYQYRELIDKERKEYIAHNASRRFDEEFFKMLEIDEQKLGEARDYSYNQQKSKRAINASGMTKKEQAVFNLNMKKIVKALDPNDKSLKAAHFAKNEDEKQKAARIAKKRNQVLFALLDEYPELRNDSVALDKSIQQRFKALNLLSDNTNTTA